MNFLIHESLQTILKRLYSADKTKGVKKRLEAADSFDAQLDCLMNREYKDDAECNIARYQKRYKREKDFMTTFLRQKGVPPDNNSCERANRVVVCVRGDGGGNRTEKWHQGRSSSSRQEFEWIGMEFKIKEGRIGSICLR